MSIKEDIAKANVLNELDSELKDIQNKINEIQKNISSMMNTLSNNADKIVRQQFKSTIEQNTELKVFEDDTQIHANTDNLIYKVKFTTNDRLLYKKLGNKEIIYKFRYRYNNCVSENMSWNSNKGEEEAKKAEITAFNNRLEQFVNTFKRLEKEGIIVEYMESKIINTLHDNLTRSLNPNKKQEEWKEISINNLLQLIF